MEPDPAKKPSTPASYAHFEEESQSGWLRTVVQFFAIPLLIVCVAVGLYLGITLMVGAGPESAADFVQLLQSDTINRRWQAAYELANRLRDGEVPAEFRDPRLVAALTDTLGKAREEGEDPPRLAIVVLRILGRLGDPASLEAVRAAVDDRDDWIRSYAIRALGGLGDRASAPRLVELAEHTDHGTRQAAIETLAQLDQVEGLPFRLAPETLAIVRARLGDRHEDVRFTAALILADAGEREGTEEPLLEMLSRERLEQFSFDKRLGGIDRYKLHSNVILKAIGAAVKLRLGDDPRVRDALARLADDDEEGDPEVREAAREALRRLDPA